jgi:acetyltransferase-like isoleucine patch superfamily enzyme
MASNYDCHIGERIAIRNRVLLGSGVHITDHFHGNTDQAVLRTPIALRALISKGPVNIGDNVWTGEGVTILPGVKIGPNAIVGANAVLSKDVPGNCIIGGVPARIIRCLSEDR